MDKINIRHLVDMYLIHSPSGFEQELSTYVAARLKSLGVKYDTLNNMLYSITPDTPLVCAHLDQVRYTPHATRIVLQNGYIYGNGNLGADDKNGVYIILRLLEKYGNKISFIFSEQEECGGGIDPILESSDIGGLRYGMVIDRRNGTDLIGTLSEYCTRELEDAILKAAPHLKPTLGAWSDADLISEHLPCVNISCGYYGAHSEREYTKLNELERAYNTACAIIDHVKGKFEKPQKVWKYDYSSAYGYNSYTYRKWYMDNEEELWDEPFLDIYDGIECPNCGYDDCITESSFNIGDYECCECGAIFDEDGEVHFLACDNYGRYYGDEIEYTEPDRQRQIEFRF